MLKSWLSCSVIEILDHPQMVKPFACSLMTLCVLVAFCRVFFSAGGVGVGGGGWLQECKRNVLGEIRRTCNSDSG